MMTATITTCTKTLGICLWATNLLGCLAFNIGHTGNHAFVSKTTGLSTTLKAANLHMDLETPDATHVRRLKVSFDTKSTISDQDHQEKRLHKTHHKLTIPATLRDYQSVHDAETSHGMPWKTSICSDYQEDHLFYMPFWEWQMKFMKEQLTNLKALPTVSSVTGEDMSYVENEDRTMRMHTICFQSDEYKLIRMTSLDAGHGVQVFTSLWYPKETLNLPVLGVDLLQFNHGKKHLCICDFQPVEEREDLHDVPYEHLLQPVRDQYPLLQGQMSDRFYNSQDSFFSKNILLGRHSEFSTKKNKKENDADDPRHMVFDQMYPAFQRYLQIHLDIVNTALQKQQHSKEEELKAKMEHVLGRHASYDTYSAARDPAHALLAKMFGQEWADDYVYEILFPLSTKMENVETRR